jgi:hypothetical protein
MLSATDGVQQIISYSSIDEDIERWLRDMRERGYIVQIQGITACPPGFVKHGDAALVWYAKAPLPPESGGKPVLGHPGA